MYEMVSFDNVMLLYDYFISVYVFSFVFLKGCLCLSVYVFVKFEERITSWIYRRYLIRFDSLFKFQFFFLFFIQLIVEKQTLLWTEFLTTK